jgi:hypothetical protein
VIVGGVRELSTNESFRRVENEPKTVDVRTCRYTAGVIAPNAKNSVSPIGLVKVV